MRFVHSWDCLQFFVPDYTMLFPFCSFMLGLIEEVANGVAQMPKYGTKKDVARLYNVTERTITTWMGAGLPHRKIGRTVRFRLDEVEEYVDAKYRVVRLN